MVKKESKKQIIKIVTQYGVHIWAILIIANAALAYAFHFSTQAASKPATTLEESLGPRTTEDELDATPSAKISPTKAPKPKGGTIDLTFRIPGIGSDSAVMAPKRLERNVTVFLYSPDSNSLNNSVKPLYTLKTTAQFDTNTLSPTYTSYLVKGLDFGTDVKDGRYQIVFRTDESLRTIIKESPTNIGGQLFEITKSAKIRRVPTQTVFMGDTLPKEGDNVVDISDYNAFVNCFGERNSSSFCIGNNYGDFDDNGVIDGVDYNLLLRSFQELLKQGQSIPKVSVAPTSGPQRVSRLTSITPTAVKEKVSPTKAPQQTVQTKSSGNVLGGILFFIFLLIVGAILFILFKKNEKFRNTILALLHKSPVGPTPPAQPADPNAPVDPNTPPADGAAQADPTTVAGPPTADATAATEETQSDPNAVAASTEIPVESVATPTETTPPPAEPAADPSAIAASTEIPVAATPPVDPARPTPADGETVERDCYVKKKLPGDASGVWLTLTDDNGALEAHYAKPDVEEGFAKVKGVMKTENGKTYLEVSEIIGEG